jgi:ATP-dependent DNA helicase RecG
MDLSPDELNLTIKQGRGIRLEWLAEGASVDTIASTLTAMANAVGGYLLIGVVGPSPAIIGVKDPNHVADRIVQAALSIQPPLIIAYPQTVRLSERPVVAAVVPRGMPHVYSHDGRFLIRHDTENKPLAPRDLRRMFIQRGDLSFETEANPRATLDDLDWEKATNYAKSLGAGTVTNVEDTLLRRGCISETLGRARPTNAGLLLFGKEPGRFVRSAEIMAARFNGDGMSDSFLKEDIAGVLPDQLRRAEGFLQDHLRKELSLGAQMARGESYEVPLEAARELVVNAIAHRDYSIDGDCIHVNLYRDRLEVTSPGGLPGPMTVDNMTSERFSRNPVIVQVLSDLRFIERLGYGVDRVIGLMNNHQLRAPVFEDTGASFRAILYNMRQSSADASSATRPAVAYLAELEGAPINPRQEAALTFLHNGHTRITNKDLQSLYPDIHAETIRRDLADLVSRSILRKLGEKRGSFYVLNSESSRAL